MTNGCIRIANEADYSRIAEIFVFNNRVKYFPIFKDEKYSFSELTVSNVITDIERIIGKNIYVYDDSDNGIIRGFFAYVGNELTKLYVDCFFQGRGYGGKLLEAAITQFDVTSMMVLEKNTRAIGFYAAHGFLPCGESCFEEGTDEKLLKLVRVKQGG